MVTHCYSILHATEGLTDVVTWMKSPRENDATILSLSHCFHFSGGAFLSFWDSSGRVWERESIEWQRLHQAATIVILRTDAVRVGSVLLEFTREFVRWQCSQLVTFDTPKFCTLFVDGEKLQVKLFGKFCRITGLLTGGYCGDRSAKS